MNQEQVTLDAALLFNMSVGKIFKDSDEQIVGLEFSDDGTLLIAYNSSALHVYDVQFAKKVKTLHNKVSRISHLKFTHSNQAVVFASQVAPHDIFCWSIYENEIYKVFKSPSNSPVTSIVMNPANDVFICCDQSMNLVGYSLDSKNRKPQLKLDLQGKTTSLAACFNATGEQLIIAALVAAAAGGGGGTQKFATRFEVHDVKERYNGRVRDFWLENNSPVKLMKHSNEGNLLACVLENCTVFLLNAANGIVQQEICIPAGPEKLVAEISFTPDSKFLIAGSEEGLVRIFEADSGAEIAKYATHIKPCMCIKFSPAFVMFASACQNLIFWIPKYWEN